MLAIPDSLVAVAEIGGNRLLALDENTLQRCTELRGRCVAIEITDLEITLFCHPGDWGLRLSRHAPAKAVDATLSGRLAALMRLALERDKVSASIQEGIRINGDASVAQRLQAIFAGLDVDWEELLSRYIGDVAAYQVGKGLCDTAQWVHRSMMSLLDTTSEYLREESRMTPTQAEFEDFSDGVTRIRDDVDRTEARLRRLHKAVMENGAG